MASKMSILAWLRHFWNRLFQKYVLTTERWQFGDG
jgi:hypothetical protein